ncbi:MAG: AroM family protein, partial [Candidatus Limnocylindrales bacterium]
MGSNPTLSATSGMTRRVAAVTIGQAPRPDLSEASRALLPSGIEIVEVGALDEIDADPLPPPRPGGYPLTTRLRDGTPVTVDEAVLEPLVQAAVGRVEVDGVEAILLLCAGGFDRLMSAVPIVRPFDAAVEALRAVPARRIAVVVPVEAQVSPSMAKWRAVDFEVGVVAGALEGVDPDRLGAVDAIVLDYVGHPASDVAALRERTTTPIVDLGEA